MVEKTAAQQPIGTVAEYIKALKGSRFGSQVVDHRFFEPLPAELGDTSDSWSADLQKIIKNSGVKQLYSHQAKALDWVQKGKNILTATPTASGKSLIYNLPVVAGLSADPHEKSLYLFPLKALAQDQLRTFITLAAQLPGDVFNPDRWPTGIAAIYDGDTSPYFRKKIRDYLPAVLITNPDMLHLALLAYHDSWGHFFAHLSYVVIDEVHTYRGVFGSHMAWVIRRLRRICRLYDSKPKFILSSATVGNPEELGQVLLDEPVKVITKSGAPRPPRHMMLLNPLDSAPYTAVQLLESALRRGLRTLVYTRSRKMTELITMWTNRRLGDLLGKISSYRAGFLPEDRRKIESRLASGDLLGVISTSALELGIDIGNLDICILVGYPGSIMATWQRAGRVGRGQGESLVIMIGAEDALDQHFMRNPGDFFDRQVEPVILNPDNRKIAKKHLTCCGAELPLTLADPLLSKPGYLQLVRELTAEGHLLQSADGATWFAARKIPQRDVDLRGSGNRFQIFRHDASAIGKNVRENIGEIDSLRVFKECHPGAVYLHMAKSLHVDHLDLDGHEVLVRTIQPNYFTRTTSTKETKILHTEHSAYCGASKVSFGYLRVTERVTGYTKRLIGNGKIIGRVPLDLPPQTFETEGLWIEIPEFLKTQMERNRHHFMGGIHAMEHAIIAMLPLLVLCDRNDIGGISHPWFEQLNAPTVFVYDGYAGGIGLTRKAFSLIRSLLEKTGTAVDSCPCETGCPSCVHSPKCGSGNRPIDKKACSLILAGILEKSKISATKPVVKREHNRELSGLSANTWVKSAPKRESINPVTGFGVFDLETKRSATEVGGWHRAERMGISVGVLYDSGKDRYFTYLAHEIDQLVDHLHRLELVVGFNNKRFDNRVLTGYTQKNLAALPTLDILQEITNQLGYRLSLNRLAEHTLGVKKSGDGLLALKWYKQGRFDLLTTYCRQDVKITRDLFLFGLKKKYLLFQNKAGKEVRLPVQFEKTIAKIKSQMSLFR